MSKSVVSCLKAALCSGVTLERMLNSAFIADFGKQLQFSVSLFPPLNMSRFPKLPSGSYFY